MNTEDIKLELLKEKDISLLQKFYVYQLKETYAHHPQKQIDDWIKDGYQYNDIKYKYDNGKTFVIKSNNKIIAAALVIDYKYINFPSYKNNNSIYFCGLYVDKDYQQKGLGKQLIEKRLEVVKEMNKNNNYKNIMILVDNSNLKAQNLLRKYGFKDYKLYLNDEITPSIDWLYILKQL